MTQERKKTGPKPLPRLPCIADGCVALADHPKSGLCSMHDRRRRRNGSTDATRRARGAGTVTRYGYLSIATDGKKNQAHRLVVEEVIGKPLPTGAEVHHVNGNKADNRNTNLVVCPSKQYHKLLHVREDALNACGNANFRKCPFCKTYSDPALMSKSKHGRHYYHAACRTEYNRSHR